MLLLYAAYEMTHAAVGPWRAAAIAARRMMDPAINPVAFTPPARAYSAALDMFERATRRYGKPAWGISETCIDGEPVSVRIEAVRQKPFCSLIRFRRAESALPKERRRDPRVLIVAPLSGHYATLLRGTVEAMLPEHDVYVTDWTDARTVPLSEGRFGLEDYTDYVTEFIKLLGPDLHVMAVCQPGPAVLAAVSMLAQDDDPVGRRPRDHLSVRSRQYAGFRPAESREPA